MIDKNEKFEYNYSAREQAEIKKIREKYTPPTEAEDKMARLRRLDTSVTREATAVSLIFGVVGALMLGFGMSLIMTDIATIIGPLRDIALLSGIVIGVLGGIIAILAYPVYNAVVKAKRKKIAPEIIRLTDELIK